jgi:hypothetical protein
VTRDQSSHDRVAHRLVPRAALALALTAQLACMPRITERCWLVTHPTPPPALPIGFAELDALLLRRATDTTLASRHLDNSLVIVFRKDFAEMLLPALCERLEQARKLSMAGRTAEAGRKYQALLVSSQVLAFAVAMQSMAQYADRRLQAGGQISSTQEKFVDEAAPILEAALGEDPREIERALNSHPGVFAGWATLLEEWPVRVEDGAHKAQVAMVVLDIAFLVVATYRAAGAAAEIAAARRPPMPPLPVFVTGGGVATAGLSGAASLEMAEVLRKLIGLGALDAGVVAALSLTLGRGWAPVPPPGPSNTAQMSSSEWRPTQSPSSETPIRNAQLAGKRHPVTGVPFDKDGFPDFRAAGAVQKEVRITYTGTRTGDYAAANKAAGLESTPKGMTWHHHQDGATMQLIRTDIHAKTGHTGGFTLGQ